MNSTPSKTFYTFQNIIDQVDIILEQIKHKNFDAVIGIQRGGLIPAVMLSHSLDIPMHTLVCSLRDHKEDIENVNLPIGITNKVGDPKRKLKYLVIDDINDTGQTFIRLSKKLKDYDVKWATLFNNKPSKFKVNYYAKLIDKSVDPTWIVYPWELDKYSK